jgi:membrane protease YdiL (CAAX protease family)
VARDLRTGGNGVGSEPSPRRRATFLIHVLAVLIAAELLFVFASLDNAEFPALLGLLLEFSLVLSLPVAASFLYASDEPLAAFLGALTLAPLLRIVSLATPSTPLTTINWLAIVSVPLLLASAAVMHALRLRPRDVFLGPGDRRYSPLNVGLIASGFGIGLLEFQIIRPAPWIEGANSPNLPFAIFVVFLTTGLVEELIFRGILLRTGVQLLGRRGGLVYVTVLFAALHIGFMSVPSLLLAFILGLVFGAVVLRTQSLWGAIGAHALANVALYLILPFAF